LGSFGRGHQPRGIVADHSLARAKFEKGSQRGQLAGDGTFLQFLVVQVAEKFADDAVVDLRRTPERLAPPGDK
jgi:hypothetical protein